MSQKLLSKRKREHVLIEQPPMLHEVANHDPLVHVRELLDIDAVMTRSSDVVTRVLHHVGKKAGADL